MPLLVKNGIERMSLLPIHKILTPVQVALSKKPKCSWELKVEPIKKKPFSEVIQYCKKYLQIYNLK